MILKKLSLIQIRTLHYIVFNKNTKKNLKIKDVRPFHYVRTSPWPIITSLSIIIILITSIEATLTRNFNTNWVITSTALTLAVIFMWWRDITRESNSGQHRIRTTKSIRIRIILFITSEVCFFFGFFWSFFWVAFEHKIGSSIQWPPSGILAFNPYRVPLLNRRILLTSGVTVTWSHKMIYYNNHKEALYGIIITIILGVIFTIFQFSFQDWRSDSDLLLHWELPSEPPRIWRRQVRPFSQKAYCCLFLPYQSFLLLHLLASF